MKVKYIAEPYGHDGFEKEISIKWAIYQKRS